MPEWQALVISIAIEAPVAFALVRWRRLGGRGALAAGLASAIATAATHPHLWAAALWAYPRWGYWPSVIVLEAIVVAVEAGLIAFVAGLTPRRALGVSLAANAASFLVGKLVAG